MSPCECSQILIVDDIDMNRYVLKQIFMSKFGIASDEATNGKDALHMVKARAYQECCCSYKIIIMDFEMPIMNGITVSYNSYFTYLGYQKDKKVPR
jgi:CheY-like chemotaxis protein